MHVSKLKLDNEGNILPPEGKFCFRKTYSSLAKGQWFIPARRATFKSPWQKFSQAYARDASGTFHMMDLTMNVEPVYGYVLQAQDTEPELKEEPAYA